MTCSRCGVPGTDPHDDIMDCADALIAHYNDDDGDTTFISPITGAVGYYSDPVVERNGSENYDYEGD